jgi:transposase InsO family protein
MTSSTARSVTSRWLSILEEYEKVKAGRSHLFATVNDLCEAHHVHRKDIRKYYERWIKTDKDRSALLPQKRGPQPGKYKRLSKEEERIILKIHRRLGANEFEIFEMLKPRFTVPPSVSTIYRTFKRYPLNVKRKEPIKRYVKRYPGELLHADTYQLAKAMMQDRKRYHLFGIVDDYSRLAYAEVIQANTAAEVTKAFFHSVQFFLAHGFRPERVMTDNGVEFTTFTSQKAKRGHFFETMLAIVGIQHIYTKPYHPQTNGKIERFWQIVDRECIFHLDLGLSLSTLSEELNSFLYRYNYERRHGGLAYTTPLDRLRTVTELLK